MSALTADAVGMVERRIRRHLRDEALTAAAILKYCPEFIGEEKIGAWLGRIGAGTIREATVLGWLEAARTNGWRPGSALTTWQRYALADQLTRFAEAVTA